jgi:hypothetical protein
LNLILFIDTEHDGVLGRIKIDADHVEELFNKVCVTRAWGRIRVATNGYRTRTLVPFGFFTGSSTPARVKSATYLVETSRTPASWLAWSHHNPV